MWALEAEKTTTININVLLVKSHQAVTPHAWLRKAATVDLGAQKGSKRMNTTPGQKEG